MAQQQDGTGLAVEANFDGIVGNTHNYAGLSPGNLASARHAQKPSHPRAAARQGLAKMKRLHDLGLVQGFLPPHERPHLPTLHAFGFTGKAADVLARAAKDAPALLAIAFSTDNWITITVDRELLKVSTEQRNQAPRLF